MMKSHSKRVIMIVALLSSSLFYPFITQSLITEDPYNTNPITIPLNLKLKFWGYGNDGRNIYDNMEPLLPEFLLHGQRFNPEINSSVHYININGIFFNINYSISYETKFDSYNNENREDFINKLQTDSLITENNGLYRDENNTLQFLSGWSIPVSSVSSFLSKYNEGITIHILNFTDLDGTVANDSKHWYRVGQTPGMNSDLFDLRSAGYVGETGIFIDPTAMAPGFQKKDFSTYKGDNLGFAVDLANILEGLIEKVIVRSPQQVSNQIALFDKVHVAQIMITGNDSKLKRKGNGNRAHGTFSWAVSNLMPYFTIENSLITIDLAKQDLINDYLDANTQLIDGIPTVILNATITERLKYLVRSDKSLYPKYPTTYYYTLFIMADSKYREYKYELDDELIEYEAGLTGFSLLNLKNLASQSTIMDIMKEQLRIFGQMVGLQANRSGYYSQFEDVQSDYGITNQWIPEYNYFDKQSMAIRVGTMFGLTTKIGMNYYRQQLEPVWYQGLNQSLLDDTATTIRRGDIAFMQGDYLGGAQFYIDGFNLFKQAVISINGKVSTFFNSVIFLVLMSMFGYIIYILFDSTLDRREFRKRYQF